ncbi:Putative Zinc finger C2H2-type [Septoria linicola]|uniref:Zinc finger C2H2-type n=1 Tax=Septoria linicola TaxID=215465 RepID=A0A9Q9EL88_9PEZI|nr:putative Zinc finger C2H2-type [Septoria linicola]USW54074.1 Putative Zinc finger C2H2-type [Septoria linicola]
MDNWQDNIDPRLLEQNVAQVGGFVSDEVPTENSQAPAHLAENSYNQHSAMNIDLDPEHVMMDLDADLPEVFYPSTPTAEASLYVNPATPVRPPSFQNHAAWNTPPSSLRADADVFYPAPSWETNNPFAPLAESHQLATLYQTPHANTTRVLLTPDTMSTGRGSHVRRGTMLSPVGRGSHYPFTVDTRNGSARERPPMSMNMNGVPANTPAAENIASWAEEAYSVPAVHLDASHLGPHTTSRPVQRSRAASVASTTGQGTFVCVGAPGKPSTNAQAHPTGSEGFDSNEFNWAFVGEEVSSMLAQVQFAQMVGFTGKEHCDDQEARSPIFYQTTSPSYRDGSAPQPFQPIPRSQPTPMPNTVTGYYAPFDVEAMSLAQDRERLAQMQVYQTGISAPRTPIIMQDRCATPNSVNGLSNSRPMWNSIAHSNGAFISQMHHNQYVQPAQTQLSMAEAQPDYVTGYVQPAALSFGSSPWTQHQQDADLEPLFPELGQPMSEQFPPPQAASAPIMPATSAPQVLSNENLGYHNLNMGPHASGHMKGWLGRAPANMLRLETGRLAPPAMSDLHLSPSSASSAGSSTGRSTRRSKEEMVLGEISCRQCDAAFGTQGDLTHHLRSHAPYQSRSHVCPHCEKRFQYRKDLARHVPRHDPNRQRFRCHFSGCKFNSKGFGRQDHLDRHLASQHRMDSPVYVSRTSSSRSTS